MANPIEEFTQGVRDVLLNSSDFTNVYDERYYLYEVPDDWSYPYVTSFDVDSDSWMTLGDVNSGEDFSYSFYSHGSDPSNLRKGSAAINDALHLEDVSMDNYDLIYARRILWNKPYPVEDDKEIYLQLIRFRFMIQKS